MRVIPFIAIAVLAAFLANRPTAQTVAEENPFASMEAEAIQVLNDRVDGLQQCVDQMRSCECNKLALAPEAEPTLPEKSTMVDVSSHVYPIRARQGGLEYHCGCVSLGGDQFLSVAHLTADLQRGVTVEVQVDGEWRPAQFRPLPGWPNVDAAYVTCPGVDLPAVETAAGNYGDSVTVYGLASQQAQSGLLSVDNKINLAASEPGIREGDSGGIVVNGDGALIGVISAFHGSRAAGTAEQRLCYLSPVPSEAAPQAAKPQPQVQAPAPQYQNCPNGQCQRPQMQVQPRRSWRR